MTETLPPTSDDLQKKQRMMRNRAIFGILLVVVILIYAVTIVKIKVTGAP